MHRTQGEDFAPNGNGVDKRGYRPAVVGQNLATRLPAEAMNAIQEEICNVIELAGLQLSSSADNDRSNGWNQLYNAIFFSTHMTGAGIAENSIEDSKITSLSFSKIQGNFNKVFNPSSANYRTINFNTGTSGSGSLEMYNSTFPAPFSSSNLGFRLDLEGLSFRSGSLPACEYNFKGSRFNPSPTVSPTYVKQQVFRNPVKETFGLGGDTYTRYIFTTNLFSTTHKIVDVAFSFDRAYDGGAGFLYLPAEPSNPVKNIMKSFSPFGSGHPDIQYFAFTEQGQTQIKILVVVFSDLEAGDFPPTDHAVLVTSDRP